jgi:ParB family chromosome partitioning protein
MKSKRLGRGLEALIPQMTPEEAETRGESLSQVLVSQVRANPQQPRSVFDRQKLEELKQSILENGLIQPITVRSVKEGYELIAGERRLRAVQELSIHQIPAYVMDVESEEQLLELALIENIQRDDLNALEVAHAYDRLQKEYNLTQEAVARKVGKDRATVANFIRLLKLPEPIQDSLKKEEISMGHARAIMGLNSRSEQIQVWRRAVKDGSLPKEPGLVSLEDRLRSILGSRVIIRPAGQGGKIEITYFSKDDLDRLMDLLEQIR